MTAPVVVLRIDATGTAFGAAPTWTDSTSSLMWVQGVAITWGRQDERAEPTPRTCTFQLKNDTGAWTPEGGSAPAGWDVGARVNVRVTLNATTYDRFDGYVDSIEPTWVGGVHTWNVVTVTCTDITARLARSQPLMEMWDQEVLLTSPTWFYPMQEAGNPANAGDVLNTAPPLVSTDSKYGPSTLQFGADLGLFERTAVTFDSVNYGTSTTGKLSVLSSRPGPGAAMPPAAGGVYFECVVAGLTAPAGSGYSVLGGVYSDDSNVLMALQLADLTGLGDGTVRFFVGTAPGVFSRVSGPSITDGKPHHLYAALASDYTTPDLWVDGVQCFPDVVNGTAMDFRALTTILVGGQLLPNGNSKNGLRGSVAGFAMGPLFLTPAQISDRVDAALGRGPVELSGARYARVASYGNVTTSGLPVGSAEMGPQRLKGKGVTEALATVARTEGSASFTTGAGALTFQARDTRYNAVAGVTLTVDQIRTPSIRRDRQGMANEITVTRNGGAAQRVVDTTSQTADGRFAGGEFEVASSTDEDALQQANWQVGLRKNPQTRIPSVNVNLLLDTTVLPVATAQTVLAATVSTLLTLTGLPSQAPTSSVSLFIEGGTETLSVNDWHVEFFTSPNLTGNVWTLEDNTTGFIDDDFVIAF